MAIQLYPFQQKAADTIATRFREMLADENAPAMTRQWSVFYYQALSALTGSGKTPILADAVSQMRGSVGTEPIVLWFSKSKVVVDQTRLNFMQGGKYAHLLDGFVVSKLAEIDAAGLSDTSTPRLLIATAGSFNQKDKDAGTLKVHRSADDTLPAPLWESLKRRPADKGRRPLFIVYDEAHNLTDQQTDLLLELEPEALIVATATLKTAPRLMRMIERLRDHGWPDERLITSVSTAEVVKRGLIKSHVSLGGYEASMEETLDPMIAALRKLSAKAVESGVPFSPKAIYVCQTNRNQDDGSMDNPAKPFKERRASPILIWRHLTEVHGVDPLEIAVYCNLKFDRKYPPPRDFVLFGKADQDYAVFSQGNYRHIIFNLSLQEGWDDPEVSFAYIDKSMGSTVQVEQLIGRVLRQPGGQHYADVDLNTAEFFVRMDDRQGFNAILKQVQKKLAASSPETVLTAYVGTAGRAASRKEPKVNVSLPSVHVDADDAVEPIADALKRLRDYRLDLTHTVGAGTRVRTNQSVGSGEIAPVEELAIEHSNPVLVRFILRRALQALLPATCNLIDWSDRKFDARVELNSFAASEIKQHADDLAAIYLDYARLVAEEDNQFQVGPAIVRPETMISYSNAVHDGYSDLNPDEQLVAETIDKMGLVWARNPVAGGFAIPLLEFGGTQNFFPDFLVWSGENVFAIDPKGEPYLATDAGRKLLAVQNPGRGGQLKVRLITSGRWDGDKLRRISDGGYTAWSVSEIAKIRMRHKQSIDEIVQVCLDPRF